VAASTKVRESHLAALETEDFEALGGDVYVRGFISAYARFLGLDPQPLLDAHTQHRAGQEPPPRGHWRRTPARTRPPAPTRVRVRSGRVAVLLVLVLVVVVGLVLAGLSGDGEAAVGLAAGWL
jgi:cytoskeleton protein RodZ